MSYIQHNTRIPVMGHADGICHIYIDAAADIDAACAVVRLLKLRHGFGQAAALMYEDMSAGVLHLQPPG